MARRIIWSSEAKQNLREIFSYWNSRNKSTIFSKKLQFQINATLTLLSTNPTIGKQTTILDVRAKSVNNYRLVYSYTGDSVHLLTIQDLRQEHLKP